MEKKGMFYRWITWQAIAVVSVVAFSLLFRWITWQAIECKTEEGNWSKITFECLYPDKPRGHFNSITK